jgi:hypothetical protein
MGRAYSFTSLWRIPASPPRCWEVMERLLLDGGDVAWWPGVSVPVPPRRVAAGETFSLSVRSPLGYRLRMRLELTQVVAPSALAARSEADLRGAGSVTVQADDEQGSLLRFRWDVTTERGWMNAAAPLLRPAFERAHEAVMRAGERGLQGILAG